MSTSFLLFFFVSSLLVKVSPQMVSDRVCSRLVNVQNAGCLCDQLAPFQCICVNDKNSTLLLSPCSAALHIVDSERFKPRPDQPLRQQDFNESVPFVLLDYHPLLGTISGLREPINHLKRYPERPEVIRTTFELFDRTRPMNPIRLSYRDEATIGNLPNYDKMYIVTHGRQETILASDYVALRDLLLAYKPVTNPGVILVDWSRGSNVFVGPGGPLTSQEFEILVYGRQAVNTVVVGREVAVLCFQLVSMSKVRRQDIHLIGYDLGGQVMHFAAEWFAELSDTTLNPGDLRRGQLIGRVTGLDPNARDFQGYSSRNILPYLNKRDASLVDIIHTSAVIDNGFRGDSARGLFGMSIAVGHLDFYPNGGQRQPGCSDVQSTVAECYHKKALKYFVTSLRDDPNIRLNLQAHQTRSWAEFVNTNEVNRVTSAAFTAINSMGIEAQLENSIESIPFYLLFQVDDNYDLIETQLDRISAFPVNLKLTEERLLPEPDLPKSVGFDFSRFPSHDLATIPLQAPHELDLPACGRFRSAPPPISGRINIGLKTLYEGQFPWMVCIHRFRFDVKTSTSFWGQSCTGSLITDEFVVTAAHCIDFYKIPHDKVTHPNRARTSSFVTFGIDCDSPIAWREVVMEEGKTFFIHEEQSDEYDFALIKLLEPIRPEGLPQSGTFNGSEPLNTLCFHGALNFGYETKKCEQLYYAGYGLRLRPVDGQRVDRAILTWSPYNVVDKPNFVNLLFWKIKDGFYSSNTHVGLINSEQHRLRNTCQGDSGGPFMWYTLPDRVEETPVSVSPYKATLIATLIGGGGRGTCWDKATFRYPERGIRVASIDVYDWLVRTVREFGRSRGVVEVPISAVPDRAPPAFTNEPSPV